ncbi:mechanosensitive ion channel family protein [Martelella sp. AMO21009]
MIRFFISRYSSRNGGERQNDSGFFGLGLSVCIGLLAVTLFLLMPQPGNAQDLSDDVVSERFWAQIRTDSPRYTMESFLNASDALQDSVEAYLEDPSLELQAEIALFSDLLVDLVDLENVAAATRRETGIRTFEYLMDIFGRIGPPDVTMFPDLDMASGTGSDSFRIPNTPLRIERVVNGPRKGEFLFAEETVRVAPRFFEAVRHLPLISPLGIESWASFGPQQTGPLVPPAFVEAMPPLLTELWFETPAWKVIFETALLLVFALVLFGIHHAVRSMVKTGRVSVLVARTLAPVLLVYCASSVLPFIALQIHLSGSFARFYDVVLTIAIYGGSAFIFWLLTRILVETIILSPRIRDESLDADLLRLGGATLGLFGSVCILALGGHAIGLPILSVVAGLGIGGLAVALAVRPTFENLIGGVILFVDRPVRVGDFCSVGDQKGTVEGIGIRSTKLRAVDRTVISIPNAQFADMQIINWAQCDQMLINETIGLRYDTTEDQLRYLLVALRRMLHAHPRIDAETVRVRFAGFGDSSLKISIRIYAQTREWNDFFAIREDVDLRILKAVHEAGTDFAFPSQTVYMAKDQGRDEERSTRAEDAVKRWRDTGQLPFPRLSRLEQERLKGTLDYPPYGSADADDIVEPEAAEPLSDPCQPPPELAEEASEVESSSTSERARHQGS